MRWISPASPARRRPAGGRCSGWPGSTRTRDQTSPSGRAGPPLTLVGKCKEPIERRYYDEVVRPLLDDDVTVTFDADQEAVLQLLIDARSLIMPIRWEEPFAMVMLEAMATGTPVVALRRGAVPELVRPGLTGLVCEADEGLPAALHEATALDPAACVAHVAENFSTQRMAAGYEAIYRRAAVNV